MSQKNHIIQFNNVVKRYPRKEDGDLFTVLDDIDLNVSDGEFITIVGPTGCGKSTLMRLILGSETPTEGKVLVDGKEVTGPGRDRGIVFQRYSLFENRTVRENVAFGLELEEFNLYSQLLHRKFKTAKYRSFQEKADVFLDRVGLLKDADKYPHQLSGGMRQRVAIAQAMIMEPKILLMDEPFGALDVGTRESMQVFVLEQWLRTKQTIIFVTHDLEEALFLGTRVILLSQYYEKMPGAGAKIVKDVSLAWKHPRGTEVKSSEAFRVLIEEIKREGLDPAHLQSIRDFDLSHSDSIKDPD